MKRPLSELSACCCATIGQQGVFDRLHYALFHLSPAPTDSRLAGCSNMSEDTGVVLPDSAASAEGVQVSLHPLPLLNISEHYTRVRIQNGGSLDGSDIKGETCHLVDETVPSLR